jgi:hypothetical protein
MKVHYTPHAAAGIAAIGATLAVFPDWEPDAGNDPHNYKCPDPADDPVTYLCKDCVKRHYCRVQV